MKLKIYLLPETTHRLTVAALAHAPGARTTNCHSSNCSPLPPTHLEPRAMPMQSAAPNPRFTAAFGRPSNITSGFHYLEAKFKDLPKAAISLWGGGGCGCYTWPTWPLGGLRRASSNSTQSHVTHWTPTPIKSTSAD